MAVAQCLEFPDTEDREQLMADRDTTYARLMAVATGGRNSHVLASMLANWSVGESALPARMGLSRQSYRAMFEQHFPYVQWHEDPAHQGEMDMERLPERDDLIQLMLDA